MFTRYGNGVVLGTLLLLGGLAIGQEPKAPAKVAKQNALPKLDALRPADLPPIATELDLAKTLKGLAERRKQAQPLKAIAEGMALYPVSKFGAAGDGKTNDTAAIQAAVDADCRDITLMGNDLHKATKAFEAAGAAGKEFYLDANRLPPPAKP